MNIKKTMTMVFAAMLATALEAAVSVTDVKAVQRWPWNGMVDIDYTVTADAKDVDVYVFPVGMDTDRQTRLNMRTLSGDGATGPVKPGKHRMTWNATADQPKNYNTAHFSVQMTAFVGSAPYVVIDLSGGSEATSYPVRFSPIGPDLSTNTCRTTELWLRMILPGTFMMGSPDTELGHNFASDYNGEDYHQVTISKAFYLGVFEVTQKQYELVMGFNPSRYQGDCRPVECVSYNRLRGTQGGALWPASQATDDTTFFGKLSAKTNLKLDLPTEAMWEYACRSGTTSALNSGKNLSDNYSCDEMNEVGRYYYNTTDGKGGYAEHTTVGSYQPNAWGLYDMHGNVSEWCLDWWQKNLGTEDVADPKGASSSPYNYRVIRGGTWYNGNNGNAAGCRSAARIYYSKGDSGYWRDYYGAYYHYYYQTCPDNCTDALGFRVCLFTTNY